ncbi:MAG: WD40 repeat domain-containing protein [Gemmataceae bacterium]
MTRIVAILVLAAAAGPLPAQPSKAPALPLINPAQARLDQTLGGLDGPCYALAAAEGAGFLIAGGENGTLIAWPRSAWMGVRVGGQAPDVSAAHDGLITALAWTGNSPLVSAGADRKVRLWAMPSRDPKQTLETGAVVRALAISADGKRLAAGDDSNRVHLFDLPDGKPTIKLTGHSDWILTLAFSPDGSRLVSGGYDGRAIVWDSSTGTKVIELSVQQPPAANAPQPLSAAVTAAAYRPDGRMLAVGTSAGQVLLFNGADGKLLRPVQTPHASAVTGLAFHPGGNVLASCSRDRSAKLWNPENGQLLMSLDGHAAWVQGVTFLEKGTRLATAGADQTVRVWDLTPKK